MAIRIEHLHKRFGAFAALDGIDLEIHQGELLALLGPSGSGKTTLLRVIAGLEHPDDGRVLFGSEDATRLSVQERRVGFVFQHYALFRHLTVADNIAFGLNVRRGRDRWPAAKISGRVEELLSLVQLQGLGGRYPAQLSGGQRQRVALARALAIEPRVLLLDEPFGALDAQVRRDLRGWLRQLHEQTGLTTVFVTHDQEEALELADRVAILNNGRIEQLATPAEAYDRPATPFVYSFVGAVNRLRGLRTGDRIEVAGLVLPASSAAAAIPGDGELDLYVRPEDLRLGEGGWEATVLGSQRSGPRVRVRARLHGDGAGHEEVEVELPVGAEKAHPPGSRVGLLPVRFGAFPAA
ncbi:sulfate/molybdate ABC transporter ATP-binding protein [Pseudoxanthomonas daejeonensis]|uniref:Sulfate ABC transporter ATP-binding protein n=1 Tax=Pseudoxanthomonas daejeonensis TaxID=266062 RepID=A0ABQ6Z5M9_9GAMM|nr:sulfate/molybdate ABC transporter ATP-binding protein [Pseudoxanthomonas daejeonensis]KAF1693497.1 sulfate ABC transporter ATP-binding protein [Pseudoxanthomonas daejeonensis]